MALCKLLGRFFVLVCALSTAISQPLSESVFRTLSAAELRDLDLTQNPGLLDVAARTGERVVIEIGAPEQGAVIQDGVNALIDCFPWLSNFPGGTIRWYKYLFSREDNLNHDLSLLGERTLQNRDQLESDDDRLRIEGEFDRYFNITRSLIQSGGAELSTRGIYECEVCVARSTEFEMCHSANVTVAMVGRAPIINCSTGPPREPEFDSRTEERYLIGSEICIFIDPIDPTRNDPSQVVFLACPSVERDDDSNIPPDIPRPNRTWIHRNLQGDVEAIATSGPAGEDIRELTPDFLAKFPLLSPLVATQFSFDTEAPVDKLIFTVFDVRKNDSLPEYQELLQAFGTWTCELSNSLGTVSKSTFISDMCGPILTRLRPGILLPNCAMVGRQIPNRDLFEVERGQTNPIPIGCNVCIQETAEVWLTITCPTNLNPLFPNTSVTFRWEDEDGNVLQGVEDTLLVQRPGTYTCRATFSTDNVIEERSRSTIISFIPDVQLQYEREGLPFDSGCQRLLRTENVGVNDVCAYLNETVRIQCNVQQKNVTAVVQNSVTAPNVSITVQIQDDGTTYQCRVEDSMNEDVNDQCASAAESITIRAFDPAKVVPRRVAACDFAAGEAYGPMIVSPGTSFTICCDTDGFPTPKVTWFRIVLNRRTGLVTEVPVEEASNVTIGPDNITITIDNYSPEDSGAYVCRAENIAGRDARFAVVVSSGDNYEWNSSPFSECECLEEERSRTVWCQRVPDGIVVSDALCDCDMRPNETESCAGDSSLLPCYLTPLWRTTEFSFCSRGCAGGFRRRNVWCAIPSTGERVHDSECLVHYGYKPPIYDFCFNKCCNEDVYPTQCRIMDRKHCENPVYQQFCCWTCGITSIP